MAVVMGTAGHIDHGKTSLVRALTGIDCDRLEEEKRRGITIELGFAHVDLPSNEGESSQRLGIVDVPGHEKFVKNMVAGASGIDFVMLVIAADEGVMPQTREHLENCALFGIRHGFVAVTNLDMVELEWLELALEDIRNTLQGTFLEAAPLFPVSSQTKQGIDELRHYITEQAKQLTPKRRNDLFRLPVDRVFTLKGHGTVVTGTMISGAVSLGSTLEVLPTGRTTKVRSLQSHGKQVETALSGNRTAINVHGLEVSDIERGDVLAVPETLFPSDRWLVRLVCLSSSPRPLRHRTEIHFHHGARELTARLYFMDRDKLVAGETALCEVRFSTPMVGVFGDHCVIRTFSPLRTVAGGVVLNPFGLPLRRSAYTPELIASLITLPQHAMSQEIASQRLFVQRQIALRGTQGANAKQLSVLTNFDNKQREKIIQPLVGKEIICFDREAKAYISIESFTILCHACLKQAAVFHQKNPLKLGMAREALLLGGIASSWSNGLHPKLIHCVFERLTRSGELIIEGDVVRLASHKVALENDQASIKADLCKLIIEGGMTPPILKEMFEKLNETKTTPERANEILAVLKLLTDEGLIIKIKDGMYYHSEIIDSIKKKLLKWFEQNIDLEPAQFRDLTNGLSRKFSIPLLEYFDKERFTIRIGDKRQLRQSK